MKIVAFRFAAAGREFALGASLDGVVKSLQEHPEPRIEVLVEPGPFSIPPGAAVRLDLELNGFNVGALYLDRDFKPVVAAIEAGKKKDS